MPTQITQLNGPAGETILRVEGDMMLDDAILLERIVKNSEQTSGTYTLIDLADLDYMDSDAASILRRLRDEYDVEFEGMEIFLQTVVNDVER